mgnify:FL=1
MAKFEIKNQKFYFNDKEAKILSGAIHYFRTVPEYWEDRLLKLKACGFNTVETYVPWNLHEPEEGNFNFEGLGDIEKFITIADKLGLFVIVRPGPYICAEWEFGGLPAWLLQYSDMKIRCYDPLYLEKVDAFYDQLLPRLKPYLCTNGGPIIAMQVENEYGSYGNDKKYLEYLKRGIIDRGVDVLLFTSDGPTDRMLQGGTLPSVYKTANFGSNPEEAFKKLREYEKDGPLMCMEYWIGWFDHWGEEHHARDPKDVVDQFDRMLQLGGNVNFYMFHGGTNFGFYNGSNFDKKLMPTCTTYDYDALLTEAGDLTDKYQAVKKVIEKHYGIQNHIQVKNTKKKAYGKITLMEQAELFNNLPVLSFPVESACPLPMEKLGQNYGFVLYRTKIEGPKGKGTLKIDGCKDRALIFLNGQYQGIIAPLESKHELILEIEDENTTLDILVENLGRVNYGVHLGERKGITGGVLLDYQYHYHWTMYPLPVNDVSKLIYNPIKKQKSPCFYKGTFIVDEKADTFLLMDGWKKGVVYINGFNIGRYWNKGPQKTLYVPGPILKEGENEIVILELHNCEQAQIQMIEYPILE